MGTLRHCRDLAEVEWYNNLERGFSIPPLQLTVEKKQELHRWVIECCSGEVVVTSCGYAYSCGTVDWHRHSETLTNHTFYTLFFSNDSDVLLFELKFGPTI